MNLERITGHDDVAPRILPAYAFRRSGDNADVSLYGRIDADLREKVAADLERYPNLEQIHVCIASFGGIWRDAQKIYAALRAAHARGARITVDVDGVAASGAAMIALAGDLIRIGANAYVLIHNAHLPPGPTAADSRYRDSRCDWATERVQRLVHRRTGLPEATIREMMDASLWFDALESLSVGFIDSIVSPTALGDQLRPTIYHEPGIVAQRWGIRLDERNRIRRAGQIEHMTRRCSGILRRQLLTH